LKISLRLQLIYIYCLVFQLGLSGQTDSIETPKFFRGQITATHNGVSLIPSFTLNRPAALFDLSLGKGRLSFDPMFRFAWDGKPWAFIFWWRYKMIQGKKFNLGIGAHPSFIFRDVSIVNSTGTTLDYLTTQRYFAWEVSPSYKVNDYLNFGLYYLGSRGLTKNVIQGTAFLAFRTGVNVPVGDQFTLNLVPQVFYLKMDQNDGTYTNITINLLKKKSPFGLNAIMSRPIKTEIVGKEFIWSVGLVYNINKSYFVKG
jgi:hypothetical protein